ncbi:recombinase family protein [Palleronia abyssalis]|uniref:recombinase family protein n=1 Tax=Palleronia abyssalis TaxID=1501240 RepID=UPI000D552FEC|nr:recombinase family protein [Palleronia abyssalis]
MPVVAEIRAAESTSLRAMAADLNARGIRTRRGGQWHMSTVRNLLKRIEGSSVGGT